MNKKLAGTGLAIGLVAGAGAGLILELSGNAGAATGISVAAVGDSTPTPPPRRHDGRNGHRSSGAPDPTTKLRRS